MKKVLFILPSFDAGGAENYLLRFVPFLTDTCQVFVMAPGGGGALLPAFRSAGCTTVTGSIGRIGWSNSTRFLQLVRTHKFNAVCTLTGTFGGWALFLAWLGGVPTRIGWHRRSSNAFRPSAINLAYNHLVKCFLERFATGILSNSATALDYFHGRQWKNNNRYRVIQNGVAFPATNADLTAEKAKRKLGYQAEDFVVGHIGRFDPAKNHKVIFEVAAMLRQTHPRIQFLFCGKDTDSGAFMQLLAQHGVRANCKGIGLHNQLAEVYKGMDLFFFPSVTEGQPNALIEAAGAGLPVLASDIPAILETTPASFHNRLIAPHNAKAFAEAIVRLFQNKKETEAYTLDGYVRQRYDLERNMLHFKNYLLC